MKLIESIMTENPCYTCGRTITVRGLMLHSVGCPQPSATVFVNNWNNASYSRACVHGFIDANTGYVYQTLPWNRRGWHAGGSANNTHIGIEMCEPDCIKYKPNSSGLTCSDLSRAKEMAKRTYNSAVELFAMLCKKYNIDPMADGAIVSHKEGCARGIASNHGDPEHLWKGLGLSYTMNTFRKDVKSFIGNIDVAPEKPTEPVNPINSDVDVNDYTVKINTDVLNVRKGPGTNYEISTTVKKGEVYTIVAENNNLGTVWGKLKSGSGYISLAYTNKIKNVNESKTEAKPVVSRYPYKVRILADVLNVRKGPGTNYAVTASIKKGEVYTIVDEKNGWGKLKSGAGYISLSYVRQV